MPDDLRARGVKFRSLTEAIDTNTRHMADHRRFGRGGTKPNRRTHPRRRHSRAGRPRLPPDNRSVPISCALRSGLMVITCMTPSE
jgi:hypothetical protein